MLVSQKVEPATSTQYELIQAPKNARKVAKNICMFSFLFVLSCFFAPWQQTVNGSGKVTTSNPNLRRQSIEAPFKGRILKWYASEGQSLKKNELIVEMIDNDPLYQERINLRQSALENKVLAMESRFISMEQELEFEKQLQENKILAAETEIKISKLKHREIQNKQQVKWAEFEANRLNFKRQKELLKSQLISQRKYELALLYIQKSEAEYNQVNASLKNAQTYIELKRTYLRQVRASTEAKLKSLDAKLNKAKADLHSAQNSSEKMKIASSRQARQSIRAPSDGVLLRILTPEDTKQVKNGQKLAYFVPKSNDHAVAFYVNGNDVALLQKGDKVRIQFEGWPAVQFSGWPSVAVGTFGGHVAFVDSADENGLFRVMVKEHPEEDEWPSPRYLRQGVKAKGWFLLKKVPLGQELWRVINGFPPIITPKTKKQE